MNMLSSQKKEPKMRKKSEEREWPVTCNAKLFPLVGPLILTPDKLLVE